MFTILSVSWIWATCYFRDKTHKTFLVAQAVNALALDEADAHKRTEEYKAEVKRQLRFKENESKKAQALANEIIEIQEKAAKEFTR